MSQQAVKSGFAYLKAQQAEGKLRWNQEIAHRFSRMLGSGYIKESLRSLWPDCPSEHRAALGNLLATAEHWRSYLRQSPNPDPEINAGFFDTASRLLDSLEGSAEACRAVKVENSKLVQVEEEREAGAERCGIRISA
jgi:hypothetical protein